MCTRIAGAAAFVTVFLGVGAAPEVTQAQGIELNIVTGGPAGTYIQIGRDIAGIGATCGQTLTVNESAGSLENVVAVRDRPVTQFGIVQSDVLEYLQTFQEDDPALRRIAEGLRIVFPLYDEEVHVLARREIDSISGLDGQRVAVGLQDSGNYITAQLVLDLAQVEPSERVTDLAPSAALEALKAGEIDAMFYVVGAPAALFAEGEIDPERFHLLPMEDAVLQAVYTPATIEAGTYPFVVEDVGIVAVKAVLITFEFEARRSAYHRAACRGVADFTYLIMTRFDELQASGHPKWQEVDVTAIPPGWSVASCALDGVDPTYSFTCIGEDGTSNTETATPTVPQANALFLRRVCERIGC
jgi:TRAP transporter TAXI family solute receptor